MKKKLPRIMACLMACVIAFNVIAIPKAKASAAVVGTSALATSALASYMTATGVPLTVISGGAAAASAGTASLVSGYAAATGATYEVVTTAIAAGTTISGGAIILGAAAVAVLVGIVAWAINEYGLDAGADPVVIYNSSTDGFYYNVPHSGDFFFEFSEIVYTSGEPYVNLGSRFSCSSTANHCYIQNDSQYLKWYYASSSNWGIYSLDYIDAPSQSVIGHLDLGGQDYLIYDPVGMRWIFTDVTQDISGYYRLASPAYFSFAEYPWLADFFNVETSELSVGLSSEYEAAPDVGEQHAMVIDTGMTFTDEQSFIDGIFNGMAAGTFNPTYTITDADTGTDTEPDTGGDTGEGSEINPDASMDTGLLRRIAIACEALADKILGGIESIFAPDPALMQEISEAFTDKFGFVSTLHNLGTDLLSINASSAPPVVYIHLEDAEGSIYYGETCKALDMSWYARYKEDGDRIMSGFLWIGFLWLLFKRASAIINGAEMATDYGTDIHDGFRIRGERNGKRF